MTFLDRIGEEVEPASEDRSVHPADWLMLLGFIALCVGAAFVGGLLTLPGLGTWYRGLHKPGWTPPYWIFGPVWSALYLVMAVAAWLVWRRRRSVRVVIPLLLFVEQLILNVAWPGVFFSLRNPALAAGEVLLLWFSIFITVLAFRSISMLAAGLMEIYLLWVTFAATLTIAIWHLNA
jgi:benzodiazapine receptor